ncbi:DUF2231 domain-containing protein [Nocardioides convexus]|uniref:DUF2231 domain-containing protein n=1 Tax=Nocardioides convexus TaxID=2712224 RepID=UPI0024185F8F|nr:DUF2231 domain-containing protein [Nocardioides convexus]
MFDLINGLPVHPLVVHVVVVLLPLAVLGTVAIVLRPSWRARHGLLVVGCAAVATALVPVATSSGEALERRVGDPGRHAALGDQPDLVRRTAAGDGGGRGVAGPAGPCRHAGGLAAGAAGGVGAGSGRCPGRRCAGGARRRLRCAGGLGRSGVLLGRPVASSPWLR